MNYHEAANFLFDLRRFRPKPGTESTAALLAHLGDPHEGTTYVQVAGSNGKGSTARTVESVLREAGLTVGLYTQPHLDDVRERVRVNGRKMPRSALAAYAEAVRPYVTEKAAEGDSPTFFEVVTGMALWEFDRQAVDVAVLEVGIGGRYDATSVVDPVASAVTSVSLEHTSVIGDTVEEIARDKAHVAPADRPLVTGATGDALAAAREQAGSVLTVGPADAAPDVVATYEGRANHCEAGLTLSGPDWGVETHLPTLGAHQATNAGVAAVLARQVGDELGVEIGERTLARGIRTAHWPGRFEVMGTDPVVVLDGAHNPGACEAVAATLAEFDYDDLHLVFGAMHEKDHRGMAAALPTPDAVVTCKPDIDRAEDETVLATVFEEAGAGRVRARESTVDALSLALDDAGPDDLVLVTGSLFAIAEARSRWTRTDVPKRVDDLATADAVFADSGVGDADAARLRGSAVHRVVKTRLQPRRATRLRERMLSVGGDCAITEVQGGPEPVDVVLLGTVAQFAALVAALREDGDGLSRVAETVAATLDLDGATPDREYPWTDGTAVMGILNVTPDSFHDGGEYDRVDEAVARAESMVEAGVDVLDVGGESTRPGADSVPVEEEIERVVPVIERLADLDALVSVDTRKAAVAEAALDAGADVLNDVSGLEDPEMRFLAAEYDVPIVVMHSIDTPVDPENEPEYDDVVEDVIDELVERVLLAEKAGLDREQIVVDPGVGFGKTARESFELLGRLAEFRALGCPVLVGHSHKSLFGGIGYEHGDRLPATIAASALAADRGADLLRVHDVPEAVAAVRTAEAARDPDRVDD